MVRLPGLRRADGVVGRRGGALLRAAAGRQKPDEAHALRIEPVEDEKFVTAAHPMEREHSITFVALASGGSLKLWRAWPQWDLQVRLPREHGLLLWHCSRDGLFGKNI